GPLPVRQHAHHVEVAVGGIGAKRKAGGGRCAHVYGAADEVGQVEGQPIVGDEAPLATAPHHVPERLEDAPLVLDSARHQRLRLELTPAPPVVAHPDTDHVAELRAEGHVALELVPHVGELLCVHPGQEVVQLRPGALGIRPPRDALPDVLLDLSGFRPEVAGNRLDVQDEVHGALVLWTTTRFFPSRLAEYIASSAALSAASADSGARSNAIAPTLAVTRGSPEGNGARPMRSTSFSA